MKALTTMNPHVRFCLAVGATVGISQGLVRITAALFGPTIGSLVSIAVVAGLAYGFCAFVEIISTAKDSPEG